MQSAYAPVKRKRSWRRWLLVVAVIGGALSFWQSRHSEAPKKVAPSTPVVLATAARRDVPQYLRGIGTVQANNTVTVRSRVDGQIMAITFREGQQVKAGDVLARLDARPFIASLQQAQATKAKDEAALANAQLDVKRYKKLGDSIARQTLDTQAATVRQLTAQVAADEAAVSSARTQLDYTTITAPISGRTGLRQIDVGNVIHTGDTNGLVVITQLQPISVLFSLPQQQLGGITDQLNRRKTLAVDALSSDDTTVLDQGELVLVDNQIDQTTGSIKLKATFPNRSLKLWPGAFVNARLLLTTEPNALTVPSVAVQQGPQGAYVFVYQADSSSVKRQPVTVARTQGSDSVITAGLEEGTPVVVDGVAKLQDGTKVSTKPVGEPVPPPPKG